MEEDGLSVARITTEDGEIVLRSDTGIPLWAGRGQSPPAVESNEPAGDGGYQGDNWRAGEGAGQGVGRGGGIGRGAGEVTGRGAGKGPADQGAGQGFEGSAGQIGSVGAQTFGSEKILL